ncbi:hypothetical protein EYF80_000980 [Liparis tanakae]|uniref:Uncharacterized protein n=1 Tax=Liparis tanakae TaxID=230148 RepID=A0A4Z2JG83_9TELE|nr:hypothetical protein EYF80_000980 [Liparis tanakae]
MAMLCAMWDRRGEEGGGRDGVRLEGGGDGGQQSMWSCSMSPGDATWFAVLCPRKPEHNNRTAVAQQSAAQPECAPRHGGKTSWERTGIDLKRRNCGKVM